MAQFLVSAPELSLEIPSAWQHTSIAVLLISALLACFFGYRLRKFCVAVTGFSAGLIIGFFVGALIGGPPAGIAAALILAVILALLAFKLYKTGIFLMTAIYTFSAVLMIPDGGNTVTGTLIAVLAFIAAIAAGCLSLKFLRPVLITATSIGGGFQLAAAITLLFAAAPQWLFPALGCVLAILGIWVQARRKDA